MNASGGVGLDGLLFVVFLVLKLTGHIAWSWWWVFAPLWIPVGVVVLVICAIVAVAILALAICGIAHCLKGLK